MQMKRGCPHTLGLHRVESQTKRSIGSRYHELWRRCAKHRSKDRFSKIRTSIKCAKISGRMIGSLRQSLAGSILQSSTRIIETLLKKRTARNARLSSNLMKRFSRVKVGVVEAAPVANPSQQSRSIIDPIIPNSLTWSWVSQRCSETS